MKRDLFGVMVSEVDYDRTLTLVMDAAAARRGMTVTHLPVHGIVTAATDAGYRAKINDFDVVAPDGQPVRWALNFFHKSGLADRCYGPEMMLRICRACAGRGIGIYLYGSTPDVLEKLEAGLKEKCPDLKVAGVESPPFRPLSEQETAATIARINDSGAGVVFIGLGCPRQDEFAWQHRPAIRAVQMCVGAAFDFHAGTKRTAPAWMQKRGLEWLFRLTQEPRRLFKRYAVTNSLFVWFALREMVGGRSRTQAQG